MEDLKAQFMQFAIDVALLIQNLSKNIINNAYCNQLIRFNREDSIEIEQLIKEDNELLVITVKSIQTTRSKLAPRNS